MRYTAPKYRFRLNTSRPEMLVSAYDVRAKFNVEMKDCPFCGGRPNLHAGPSPHVTCMGCGADGPALEATRDNIDEAQFLAIEAWNTRGAF